MFFSRDLYSHIILSSFQSCMPFEAAVFSLGLNLARLGSNKSPDKCEHGQIAKGHCI